MKWSFETASAGCGSAVIKADRLHRGVPLQCLIGDLEANALLHDRGALLLFLLESCWRDKRARARAGGRRDYGTGLESMSTITSLLNESQKQQGRRRTHHSLPEDSDVFLTFTSRAPRASHVPAGDYKRVFSLYQKPFILSNESSGAKAVLAPMFSF